MRPIRTEVPLGSTLYSTAVLRVRKRHTATVERRPTRAFFAVDTVLYLRLKSIGTSPVELPTIFKFMKDALQRFFDIASSHPNPLLVSAVSYDPPLPHHFCRRPRNVLLDPPDDLTVEVEKLIEGSYAPTAFPCRNGRVSEEGQSPWLSTLQPEVVQEVFSPCESDTPVCPGTRTAHCGFFSSFPPPFARGKL
ncbi:hypothetical protein EVAR_2662_1 [Eumeta japonica]|uniref:Uncharacterized protein n=1 Tax=Eumeta variegata TaxID=151549 RepID=A0A4C1SPX5_EUMVA|nr:hypothetical protein EVAR_2662_1 [Eumeta japonica]